MTPNRARKRNPKIKRGERNIFVSEGEGRKEGKKEEITVKKVRTFIQREEKEREGQEGQTEMSERNL